MIHHGDRGVPHRETLVPGVLRADQVVRDESMLSNDELADLHAEFNQNLFADDDAIREDTDDPHTLTEVGVDWFYMI
jgi:hypothetical protein